MKLIIRVVERVALLFRLPGPVPEIPDWPKPHRGASRDRTRPGKARRRSRRAA